MKRSWIILCLLSIAACNSGGGGSHDLMPASDSAASDPKLIPHDVQKEPLVNMTALTSDQKTQIRMINDQARILPSLDLILYNVSTESDSDRLYREQRIAEMSYDTHAIYISILTDCQITEPQDIQSGTQTQVSGAISSVATESSILGQDCPIAVHQKAKIDEKIISSDPDPNSPDDQSTKEIVKETNETSVVSEQILDTTLQARADRVSSEVKEATYFKSRTNLLEEEKYSEEKISMKGQSSEGLSSGGGIIRTYIEFTRDGRDKAFQSYARFNMNYVGIILTLQIYKNLKSEKIYLNGRKISRSELQYLFPGSNF